MITIEELVRRKNAGEKFTEISAATGISRNTLKGRYRRIVPYEGARPMVDPDRLRELWAEGLSLKKIGGIFGVSDDTVMSWQRRLGLPSRPNRRPPCFSPDNDWTDDERGIVIAQGYSITEVQLAAMLPGRSPKAVGRYRARMHAKGLIVRPDRIAGHSRKMRAKPMVERAPKPVRVNVEPKPRAPRVRVAKPAPPKQVPVRAVLAPLPPEPVARDLPPGTEILIRRPWSEIKRMGLGIGIIMTEMHDLDRLNRRRAELKLPPVYIRTQAVA